MHKIEFTLSELAQRAALLAGQPATATQTHEVPADLVAALCELPGTRIDYDGQATYVCPWTLVERPADAAAAIAAAASHVESVRAACLAAWRTAPVADLATGAVADVPSYSDRCNAGWRDVIPAAAVDRSVEVDAYAAARAAARAAAVNAWLDGLERDHAVARAAGLPDSGRLDAPSECGAVHGDGCGFTGPERIVALRAAIRAEDSSAAERARLAAVTANREYREWLASGPGPLARAAADQAVAGASLRGRALADIRQRIGVVVDAIAVSVGCHGVALTYGGARACTALRSDRAYALSDALVAACDAIAVATELPGDVAVVVGPLAYHDVADTGSRRDRLGYAITASHRWLTATVVALLDSPPLDDDEDEDDDD